MSIQLIELFCLILYPMFSNKEMDETDNKTSGDKINSGTAKGTDCIADNENVKHKEKTRHFRWDKKRPDTPMTSESIKFEWRRTHSSDSFSTSSSCPNSASLPNSGILEDHSTTQSVEPPSAIILQPLVFPMSKNSCTNDSSDNRVLTNNDGKSVVVPVPYFHFR